MGVGSWERAGTKARNNRKLCRGVRSKAASCVQVQVEDHIIKKEWEINRLQTQFMFIYAVAIDSVVTIHLSKRKAVLMVYLPVT